MKITKIETLRTIEFVNVLWVRVHTDSGVIGLGETFYGAGAVEAHIHDTLAGRLLGRNPLHIEALHREMLNLPMAQSSTGVEYRAASAIDIALWDMFGKVCNQPVHQMLGDSAAHASASIIPSRATAMCAPTRSSRCRTGTAAMPTPPLAHTRT